MKFSAFLGRVPVHNLLPIALALETNGWDSAAIPDSVFFPQEVSAPYPHAPDGKRFWPADSEYTDPLVVIPAMAALTKRLSFFTAVLKAPLRQPLLLAKSLGSLAALFPDRMALGVGTSWIPEEFIWLHEEMKTRGARLDEMIEIIRRCLSPGWAEFHGKHYDFGRLVMHPCPGKPIPIYVGGHEARALRRAAYLGDGWISVNAKPDELKATLPALLADRATGPRATEPFEIVAMSGKWPTVDDIHRLTDLGVTTVTARPFGDGLAPLSEACDAVKRFADDVIARIRTA